MDTRFLVYTYTHHTTTYVAHYLYIWFSRLRTTALHYTPHAPVPSLLPYAPSYAVTGWFCVSIWIYGYVLVLDGIAYRRFIRYDLRPLIPSTRYAPVLYLHCRLHSCGDAAVYTRCLIADYPFYLPTPHLRSRPVRICYPFHCYGYLHTTGDYPHSPTRTLPLHVPTTLQFLFVTRFVDYLVYRFLLPFTLRSFVYGCSLICWSVISGVLDTRYVWLLLFVSRLICCV